ALAEDIQEIVDLTLENTVIRDRFTGTAVLTHQQARDLGCLGYVARASGLATDARIDHPVSELVCDLVTDLPGDLPATPLTAPTGDVLARFTLRATEFAASTQLAVHLINAADLLSFRGTAPPGSAGLSGVGIVEGWRGTIVHRVEVEAGRLTRVKIVDPSWFNWPALPLALAATIVPDFPVTNKSFNLSYAGNDL
ncbi:MAG: hypothetical protein QOE58_608, partial [Actinomycetota bacterium]|nr:hypothetical protein [Actinomycetota bacterium]